MYQCFLLTFFLWATFGGCSNDEWYDSEKWWWWNFFWWYDGWGNDGEIWLMRWMMHENGVEEWCVKWIHEMEVRNDKMEDEDEWWGDGEIWCYDMVGEDDVPEHSPKATHYCIYIQWGPTATKPEMLVFETPKTGLLKVSLRTHNHMLSTQLPRVQAYTHTQREGPWMQGMVSCKKKPPFLDLLRSMSAQHGETYKATFTVSGPWLRMWQWNSDEYSWH